MTEPNGSFTHLELFELLELAESKRISMREALRDMLAIVDHCGGFMSHGDQMRLRKARATLMENEG